ncbi:MAG: DUF2723 domain-containing protein [Elusimicrobiota bacterium]|nr:MAG: DUF2723 domain-containing protein [Elusimicrobiota bacterium]
MLWAVPHPPGYPLLTALGWAWSRLPWENAGAAVNGLSGLLHAGAASVLFLLLRGLGSRPAAALTGALLMALSPLFWYYSLVAEVRALNDLLAVGAALFAAAWGRDGRPRDLRLFALCFGLGLSHHPTYVFLVPAFVVWLSARRPSAREALRAAALAAGALAFPYLLLAARLAAGAPGYNLFEVSGLGDMPGLFLRTGLGGPLKLAAAAPALTVAPGRFAEHLGWFLSSAWTHAGPAALALAAFGTAFLWRTSRRELAAWAAWLAVSAGVYLVFSSAQSSAFVDEAYARAVAARFHLLPLIAVFALAGRGAESLARRTRPALAWGLAAAAALGPLAWRPLSLARENPLLDHVRAMLRDTKPGDVIILGADDDVFAALELELVRGQGGGRAFVAPTMFGFPPYVRRLRRAYPDLVLPAQDSGLSFDWGAWKRLNPGRDVLAVPAVLGPVLASFPNSVPQGSLVRIESAKTRSDPAADARRFLDAPETAAPPARAWTQEVYLAGSRRIMAAWLGSRLDPVRHASEAARLSLLMERP